MVYREWTRNLFRAGYLFWQKINQETHLPMITSMTLTCRRKVNSPHIFKDEAKLKFKRPLKLKRPLLFKVHSALRWYTSSFHVSWSLKRSGALSFSFASSLQVSGDLNLHRRVKLILVIIGNWISWLFFPEADPRIKQYRHLYDAKTSTTAMLHNSSPWHQNQLINA